jgi:hypothetical protein
MGERMTTDNNIIYHERISSRRTALLFIALTILFFLLFVWRMNVSGWNGLVVVLLILSSFFLFYVINYRILIISITSDSLKLSFGIFAWTVPFDNIESCSHDEIPATMKYGGAGIHFMFIGKRYRASFNFLEYPRLVIGFKNKVGLVNDLSFSTRQPEELLKIIQEAIVA